MKRFIFLAMLLTGLAAKADSKTQSTFQNFVGNYRVVQYEGASPKCLAERTVFPCLKIGDIVRIDSTTDEAVLRFLKVAIQMKAYSIEGEGRYSDAFFSGDGISSASWQQRSNSSMYRNSKAAWISTYLPGYLRLGIIPAWHNWDETRFDTIVEKVD